MSVSMRCLLINVPNARLADTTLRPDEVFAIGFADLSRHLPPSATLELVVAPLFCSEFDALEIIETLGGAGYRGSLRILSPRLPNRQIVLRELRGHAVRQGITLEIVEQS